MKILQAAIKTFPRATATVDVDADGRVSMTLTIPQLRQPIVFHSAADAPPLAHILGKIRWRIFGSKGKDLSYQANELDFSITRKLRDWQTFRRTMYERDGQTCRNAVIHYLREQNDEALTTLQLLGLAPQQVEGQRGEIPERDISIFRAVAKQPGFLGGRGEQKGVSVLERLFPRVFQQLLDETARQEGV